MSDPLDPRPDPTDAALAARLREVVPPKDLRRRLIALAPGRRRRTESWWMTLGSLVAVVAVAICVHLSQPQPWVGAVRDLRTFLASDFSLTVTGRPLAELQAWLETQGASTPGKLPPALVGKVPEGCRVLEWNGYRASLICFETPAGVVHLVTFPAGTFPDFSTTPRLVQSGSWSTALWRNSGGDFLLFGETDPDFLRQLL